jgi:hypothetical protein
MLEPKEFASYPDKVVYLRDRFDKIPSIMSDLGSAMSEHYAGMGVIGIEPLS